MRLYSSGDAAGARRELEAALPGFRAAGDRKSAGRAANALSLICSDLGEYRKALEWAREAVAARRDAKDATGEAQSTNNLGLAWLNLGEYGSALEEFERALTLHRVGNELEDVVTVLNNIGNVFFFLGRYSEAFDRYREALDVVGRNPAAEWGPHERLRTVTNLAALQQKLGRYDLALNLYAELRRAPGVLTPNESARMLSNLGALYRRLGDPVKALETFGEAQALFRKQRHVDGETGALKNAGIALALDLEDYPAALIRFREALELALRSGNRREETQCRLYIGETLQRMNRAAEARSSFQDALALARERGLAEEEWKALFGIGRLSAVSGDRNAALEMFRAAVNVIESVRSRVATSSLRSGFLADKRDVYDSWIEALAESNPGSASSAIAGEVYAAMERSRSRAFREQLAEAMDAFEGRSNPAAARELREIRGRMSLLWMRQTRASGTERDAAATELAALEKQYLAVEQALAGSDSWREVSAAPSLETLRRRLPADTALVEYSVGPSSVTALVVTSKGALVFSRRLDADSRADLGKCAASLGRREPGAWRNPCRSAADTLLSGVLPAIDPATRQLVLVPDGDLSFLPFEALPQPGGDEPLITRYGMTYLPAATLYEPGGRRYRASSRFPWNRMVVALGDPVLAASSEPSAVLDRGLGRLPFSGPEAESVAKALGGRAALFLGKDAMKSRLLAPEILGYRVLHAATHAIVDPESPQRSRILFSPAAGSNRSDYLFLGELFNLDLRNFELVTFSACETGLGRVTRGEGPQDFSRALLINGAAATLTALWRVSDEATAAFMREFYLKLAAGESKANALRDVKLAFLRSGTTLAEPYFWASFVLAGDGASPVPVPWSWGAFVSFSAAAVLALFALALLLVRAGRTPERAPRPLNG